jgi:hypothetical protein
MLSRDQLLYKFDARLFTFRSAAPAKVFNHWNLRNIRSGLVCSEERDPGFDLATFARRLRCRNATACLAGPTAKLTQ